MKIVAYLGNGIRRTCIYYGWLTGNNWCWSNSITSDDWATLKVGTQWSYFGGLSVPVLTKFDHDDQIWRGNGHRGWRVFLKVRPDTQEAGSSATELCHPSYAQIMLHKRTKFFKVTKPCRWVMTFYRAHRSRALGPGITEVELLWRHCIYYRWLLTRDLCGSWRRCGTL